MFLSEKSKEDSPENAYGMGFGVVDGSVGEVGDGDEEGFVFHYSRKVLFSKPPMLRINSA